MRKPNEVIGDNYLMRWHLLPRNRFLNIYLHKFVGSDDDRALHDHPWLSLSLILRGSYREHFKTGSKLRRTLDICVRRAKTAHRVEVVDGPVWTIFVTGPRIREWGFHCPKGWRHWKVFCEEVESDGTKHSRVGRGCD